jgi:hypothetical protein
VLNALQSLFTSGHIMDLVVALIVFEILLLALRRPAALPAALPSLCAGLGLALGLRAVLVGAGWPWLLVCVAGSGIAHGFEVRRRWRA